MVGRFDIKEKSIDWTGSIGITEDNPDNIVVDTKQLEVKMRVEAYLWSSDESHYLGYVQSALPGQLGRRKAPLSY